ncbi:MAG: nucleotidyltransferase family protein [Chloroflexales bacterium]|nr:nucleotidyltransferase family protein [Chloroflexales bacterium]
MPTTYTTLCLLLVMALGAAACTASGGGLGASDGDAVRIVFKDQQSFIERDGLALGPGESETFLFAAEGVDRYTFQIDADYDVQFASEVHHPNGKRLSSGYSRALDWHSSRTASGDFRVILTNESADDVTYRISAARILPTADQTALDDLLARFTAAGIAVEHAPSIQRDTIFDKLYRREIAARETLYIEEPQQRVDVYIFADEQTAQEAAAKIEPGASQLVWRSDNGVDSLPLDIESGSIPLWWLSGRFVLYTAGPNTALEQKLTTMLGDPLGVPAANSVSIRVHNRTGGTLTNVHIRSGADEVMLPDLSSGISGYHTLASDSAMKVAAEYRSQSSTIEIGALPSGAYLLDMLAVENDRLLARPFDNRTYYVATDLINQKWLWQHTDRADGSRFAAVSADREPSYLRFRTSTTGNIRQAGLGYGGNMGCNGMGGAYFANADGALLLGLSSSTLMGCEEAAMESEDFWRLSVPLVYRYTIEGDTLRLFVANGDTFVFAREGEISAENRIYRSIMIGHGSDTPILIVAESAAGRPGATPADIRTTLDRLFGASPEDSFALQAETVDDFLARNAASTGLAEVLTLDADMAFIDPAELDALFANGEDAGWDALAAQYNGAETILTFSLPGFGATGDQALVYCGVRSRGFDGGYYALKFNSGDDWYGGSTSLVWSEED